MHVTSFSYWCKYHPETRYEALTMCPKCASPNDPVNHPAHYTTGKIEVLDFIEDQKLPYHLGNVVKYVARAQHKGSALEDLKKARFYLDRHIALLEKGGG